MSTNEKLLLLSKLIEEGAKEFGLMFVTGEEHSPISAVQALTPIVGNTNGQDRGVYVFAVANKPKE